MWVITTATSASGSMPARRSFWTGLPPQSSSTAPSGAGDDDRRRVAHGRRNRAGGAEKREMHQGDFRLAGSKRASAGFVLIAIERTVNSMRSLPSTNISWRYGRSEEHTSELQSLRHLVCRLLLEVTPTTTIYTLSLHDALPI